MIDKVIQDAIEQSVKKHGQPDEVCKLINNWYEQVIAGNEVVVGDGIAIKNNAFNHLDRIFDAMWSPTDEGVEDVD